MAEQVDVAIFDAYEFSNKVSELAYLYNHFRCNLSMIAQTNDSASAYEVGTKYDLKFVNNYLNYEGTNFVPCYRISNNMVSMYDIVNNVFSINTGTGEFIKGDNKKSMLNH